MDAAFWRERWRERRIAFHEGQPNPLLVAHAARLGARRRVLVPLCGKAEDLAHLAAAGHEVVGVELVEHAAREYFADHGQVPTEAPAGAALALRAGAVTILVGDFFAVTRADVGPVDAYYDRAAMVALPEPLRARYVERVRALLPVGAPGLVITIEYPPGAAEGPPFAVTAAELRARWAGSAVEELETVELAAPRTATCFAIVR